MKPNTLFSYWAGIALLLLAANPARAINRTVTNVGDSGPGTLRAQIGVSGNGDNIDFAITGMIVIASELSIDKSISINGPGASLVTVTRSGASGAPAYRIFEISNGSNGTSPGPTVSISGLTISNGLADGSPPANFGGGILNNHANLTLIDCAISGNNADYGAGVYSLGSNVGSTSLTVTNCTFSNNSAVWEGGGIYSNGANDGSASLNVTLSTFAGNHGNTYGGGGLVSDGGHGNAIATIQKSTFSGNITGNNQGAGGGIANIAGTVGSATLAISESTIQGNTAVRGAGIYNSCGNSGILNASATLAITNCTLSGNIATNSGGGVYNQAFASSSGSSTAGANIFHSTFAKNSAPSGSSVLNASIGANGAGSVQVGNDIFQIANVGPNFSNTGSFSSLGYDLSSDDGSGLLVGPSEQLNTDPQLDALGLQNNGGPTQTIALTSNSPAIDKGKNFGVTVDQREQTRPFDNPSIPNASGGDGSDIGAYEAPQDATQGGPGLVVTTTNDHDDGVCGSQDCSLREAIARSNAVPGAGSIVFARNLGGTITLTMGELDVTDSLTIIGFGVGTISGNNASRIFNFSGGSSSLSYLTIRDGRNQVLLGNVTNGGGIYNSASLYVYGCSFINDRVLGANALGAASGGVGQGGGIYNLGTLYLDTSAFTQSNQASGGTGGNGNSGHGGVPSGNGGAGRGGAVFNDTTGSLLITNCTFNGNAALGGNGGSGGPLGGNGGNGDGGAIYNLGAMTIKSGTISGNSGGGGAAGTGTTNGTPGTGSNGVTSGGGTATVANSIIAGNVYVNGRNDDVDGPFGSSGYNLIGNGDFSTGFNATGDQVGTTAAPINPLLGSLQNNGGPTSTMLPQTNSLALDRGFAFGLTNDQRGRARPFDDPAIANAPGGDGSDIGAVEIGSGPAPASVVSRKIHVLNNQIFDIALSADTLGDECRSGGVNGNYTLIFTFAAPVTFTSASVCAGIGMVTSASAGSNQITVNLTGVTSAEVLTICLSNVNDGTTSGSVSYPFRVLVGDTTGNASVNASDISLTKLKSGQAVDATNFRTDVTVNNSINASDVSLVKSKSGTALP